MVDKTGEILDKHKKTSAIKLYHTAHFTASKILEISVFHCA